MPNRPPSPASTDTWSLRSRKTPITWPFRRLRMRPLCSITYSTPACVGSATMPSGRSNPPATSTAWICAWATAGEADRRSKASTAERWSVIGWPDLRPDRTVPAYCVAMPPARATARFSTRDRFWSLRPAQGDPKHHRGVAIVVLALFTAIVIRTAWVSDDAYITFRTVANLLHGDGARWNVAERVPTNTPPLWMLTLAAIQLVTREPYFTAIGASIALSLAAVSLLAFRVAQSSWQAIVAVLILASARSFIDFSTSGLENALSHFLIVLLVIALMKPVVSDLDWRPIALASLVVVNRLDLVWLVGPGIVTYVVSRRSARAFRQVAIGLLPLVAWELFSVVYYGFAVANTAFAKPRPGIPEHDLLMQGLRYLQESWQHDPVTLTV